MAFENRLKIVCSVHKDVELLELNTEDGLRETHRPTSNAVLRFVDPWQPNAETRAAVAESSLPIPPDIPDTPRHVQWTLRCSKATCNYEQTLGDVGDAAMRSLLRAMWRRGIKAATCSNVALMVYLVSNVGAERLLDQDVAELRSILEVDWGDAPR